MKNIITTILVNAFFTITVCIAQTNIPGGDVSGTWSVENSPYLINENITIPNDSTLIIEPGVIVEFQGYYSLDVQGRLLAVGTKSDSIFFTVNDTTGFSWRDTIIGGWNGIQFIDTQSENDTSKFVYCTIQYGKAVGSDLPNKSGGAILISNFNKVLISNCLINNNSAGGSDSPSGGGLCLLFADIILKDNEISHNRAWDGGAIQIWESDPVFTNNQIACNIAETGGGAIWIGGSSDTEFNGDVISGNTAGASGGGIICWQNTNTTLNLVSFKNNVARWGGGIGVIDGELQADSCYFTENGAIELGGGLNSNYSTVVIANSNFERDTASVFGGAMGIYNSELSVKSCQFTDNNAAVLGGGIHSDFSDIIVENSKFERDSAGNSGGGLFAWKCYLEINNSDFITNKSKYSGGAIYTDSTVMTINNSGFVKNTATDNGGAIFLYKSVITNINNSSFERNNAIWGGGILSGYGSLNLKDCSFAENLSDHGGAVNFGFGKGEFKNVSFLKNAGIWGGGISAANCDLTIDGCFFSLNTATNEAGAMEYFADTTIFERRYKLTVRETDFIENSADTRSGAVRFEQTREDTSLVDLMVDSCQFAGNHSYVHGSLRMAGSIKNFVVSNSLFKGNTAERNTGGPGFMAYAKGEVNNCIFNSNYYAYTDSTKSAHGASLQTEAEVDFMNCTFTDTSSAKGYAVAARRGANASLTNCILWKCGNNPIILTTVADLGCRIDVNFCDIENGIDSIKVTDSMSEIIWGDGNIAEDPYFVNPNNGDLHLQNSSPCIGSGTNTLMLNEKLLTAPSFDFDGNTRPSPRVSKVDMGAYEHNLGIPVSNHIVKDDKTTLYQNYPNPVKNSTTFSYCLDSSCYVELNIYNMFGQKIRCLVAEKQPAGTYTQEWKMNEIETGQYLYKLQTSSGFMQSRKLVVLK